VFDNLLGGGLGSNQKRILKVVLFGQLRTLNKTGV